jgi:hypothetical protein
MGPYTSEHSLESRMSLFPVVKLSATRKKGGQITLPAFKVAPG